MREISRNGKRHLIVDGEKFEFDGVVKIYIDSSSGSWVVDTNLDPKTVIDVLDHAGEHFLSVVEETHDLPGTVVVPMKDTSYQ